MWTCSGSKFLEMGQDFLTTLSTGGGTSDPADSKSPLPRENRKLEK